MTIPKPVRRATPPPREGGLPITWLLSLTLIGLVLTAVLPVVALGYYAARESTGRLLRDRSELVPIFCLELTGACRRQPGRRRCQDRPKAISICGQSTRAASG